MVGWRGEAPLVSPYILCNLKLDGTVTGGCRQLHAGRTPTRILRPSHILRVPDFHESQSHSEWIAERHFSANSGFERLLQMKPSKM